ncbi:hypothetical protein Tco_1315826 [Tanacetum coccineum]
MAEPILYDNMAKAPTESNLSITCKFNKEFLLELRKNIYHRTYNEDVVDHIAKVLKMVDLIYVPGTDSHQLRMKIFPLSLADDAKEWWISDGDGKSPLGRNLLRRSSVDSILNHMIERMKYDNILRSNNTTADSFFKPYLITHGKSDTEKEDEQSQTKRKYCNASNSIDEQPNKRRCIAEKFEAIQYSLGPNEEYIAIRSYEYDIWERNEDNMPKIYKDIFSEKGQRMDGD